MALLDILGNIFGGGSVTPGNSQHKINNFLSEVRTSGLSKPNRFEVIITNPICVRNPNWGTKVGLFCDQAMLPMTRLITSRQQLFGPPSFHPVGVDYGGDNMGMQFLVDRNMEVKKYFDSWMDGIVNRTTYTTAYQRQYLTSMIVRQLDEADNVTYAVKFEDIFPTVVNVLNLDHTLSNTVHKLNVTFNYRRWTAVNVGAAAAPGSTNLNPMNNLSIQNGQISYTNDNLTAQQQAQNLLSPGYNAATGDTFFIVQ